MKKTSDKIASRVGKVTLGLGLIAAIASPFAGAAFAAYSTGSAALASLGLGAAVPLAGAGMFGGFVLGTLAAPVVVVAALVTSGVAALAAKGIGSVIEWMASGSRKEPEAPARDKDVQHRKERASEFKMSKLSPGFDQAAALQLTQSRPAPKPEYKNALQLRF